MRPNPLSTVEFWDGVSAELDLLSVERSAMSVKGCVCPQPLRFLDIYQNLELIDRDRPAILDTGGPLEDSSAKRYRHLRRHPWSVVRRHFLPTIPDAPFALGDGIPQPPYVWRDCDPYRLAVNFTYNSSAIFRILNQLATERAIAVDQIPELFDRACESLAIVYKARRHFVLRNMNNNFSMYLVPKVIEYLLGKAIYDADVQDATVTNVALRASLAMLPEYASMDVLTLMAVAIGKGVAFMEQRVQDGAIAPREIAAVQDALHPSTRGRLAIDHRAALLDMIENAGARRGRFHLTAVLDDATESVDDLLWLLALLRRYAHLTVEVVINTARVSVNFAFDMLPTVLGTESLAGLSDRLGAQFRIVRTYCPLMSLQPNCMTGAVRAAIGRADAVFVKGASYFETLQLLDKDVFYGFVVHGPISVQYTGLKEFDAVFAWIPAGQLGYVSGRPGGDVRRLTDVVAGTKEGKAAAAV